MAAQVGSVMQTQTSLMVFDRSAACQPATKADRQIAAANLGVKTSAYSLRTRIGR